MRLYEAESEEQVLETLAENDKELLSDIRQAVRSAMNGASYWSEWESMDPSELVGKVDAWTEGDDNKLLNLVSDDAAEILSALPVEAWPDQIRDWIDEAAQNALYHGSRRTRHSTPFSFSTGQGGGTSIGPSYYEMALSVGETPPLSWVPEKVILDALNDEIKSEWEPVGDGGYRSGWLDSYDDWRIETDNDRVDEWAYDLRTEYLSHLVDSDPKGAIAIFRRELAALDKDLAKRVDKAKLPEEVLLDYVVAFFANRGETIEMLHEVVGDFGYQGSRGEVMLEISKDTLSTLGITQGRWWDGAPWRLVNLPPKELAYEGTLQRHCVGQHKRGYREAVERGATYIWSLRSAFNLPILTFEVNRRQYDASLVPDNLRSVREGNRAESIEQLKGKLNRLSGQDPEEAAVLLWIFKKLGVNPAYVYDYVGPGGRMENPRSGFDAPWRPYHERAKERCLRW